jgi:hypothetical protein
MADYITERMFKHLSADHINGVFDCFKVDPEIDRCKIKNDAGALAAVWNAKLNSKDPNVTRMHDFLQSLHDFAESKCDVTRVAEELADGGEEPYDLPEGFRDWTRHDQGAFLVLNNEMLWENLISMIFADEASNTRYWTVYSGLPETNPDITPENITRLKKMLKEHFAEDKHSKSCDITNYIRGSQYYLFATLEDKPKYYEIQNEANTGFEPTPLIFPFRLIFAYDEEHGEFSIYAEISKAKLDPLVAKIVNILVGHKDDLQRIGKPSYNLSKLSRRGFAFPTDPKDGIESVRVKGITIAPLDAPQTEIFFKDKSRDIYDCIDDFANRTRLKEDNIEVRRVAITMKINSPVLKFRSLTFEIGLHTCTLKSMAEAKKTLGEKYIKEWGFRNEEAV